MEHYKGQSPFFPGQPVPVDSFSGRQHEVERIKHSIQQVAHGKPQMLFLTGEYGIGKSSLAKYMKHYAEKHYNLFGIHILLGGAETTDDLATRTIESVLKSQAYEPS